MTTFGRGTAGGFCTGARTVGAGVEHEVLYRLHRDTLCLPFRVGYYLSLYRPECFLCFRRLPPSHRDSRYYW